jgi:hypothetical protein
MAPRKRMAATVLSVSVVVEKDGRTQSRSCGSFRPSSWARPWAKPAKFVEGEDLLGLRWIAVGLHVES